MIASEPASTWEFDAHCLATRTSDVLALGRRVRQAFTISASEIFVTKTMLGLFGCVPAFDFYFCKGFACNTLCAGALTRTGTFYREPQSMDLKPLCPPCRPCPGRCRKVNHEGMLTLSSDAVQALPVNEAGDEPARVASAGHMRDHACLADASAVVARAVARCGPPAS